MRIRLSVIALTALLASMLTGCGSEPSGGGGQAMSYKDMKSMVIDILKTEDAQKALQESTMQSSGGGSGLKLLSVQDKENVRMAVKDVLVSPEYDKVIKQLMTDTRFAGEFAKAVNKQNKEIHKDLLKDPTYQKDLIQVMKNPEMDKMILDVLQSTQYRKQVMGIMQDTMQNPIFRLEMMDLMKKAVQDELKPKPNEKITSGGEGGSEDGGGDGGGEGESSS
ncbi:spore germination lipoprotein GerD [Paenibacillus beijingensis]|uniref:Spore gernimation protein n=1 Tax=Paenibacillus beijingensis TaxID=1126833 RepID=A0A0D5NJY2_9BACL|nr:spore germination lipoprotein GerD [Paenibacillus beijingensis]AJY75307.1 spore gernimation protein [Paenibacillus beijingensis]